MTNTTAKVSYVREKEIDCDGASYYTTRKLEFSCKCGHEFKTYGSTTGSGDGFICPDCKDWVFVKF